MGACTASTLWIPEKILDLQLILCTRAIFRSSLAAPNEGKEGLNLLVGGSDLAITNLYDKLAEESGPEGLEIFSESCAVTHFSLYLTQSMIGSPKEANGIVQQILSITEETLEGKYKTLFLEAIKTFPKFLVVGFAKFTITENKNRVTVARLTFRNSRHANFIQMCLNLFPANMRNCNRCLRKDPRSKEVSNTKTKKVSHYLLSHKGMHSMNGNIDNNSSRFCQTKRFTIQTDTTEQDSLIWAHWNCGGLGKPEETLAQFNMWLKSLLPNTHILSVCELKSVTNLNQFLAAIKSQFGFEFRCFVSILTKDQQSQLHAAEIELNRKDLNSTFGSKGSHMILIKGTLLEPGQPFHKLQGLSPPIKETLYN